MTAPAAATATHTVVDTTPTSLRSTQQWLSVYIEGVQVAFLHRRQSARGVAPWRVRFVDDPFPCAEFWPRSFAEQVGLNARVGSCQVFAGGRTDAIAYVVSRWSQRA